MTEFELLKQRVQLLEGILFKLAKSDRFIFERDMEIVDGRNFQLSTATGTKIGTATTQKLGFFNATPVVQPNAQLDSDGVNGAAGQTLSEFATFTGNVGSEAYTLTDIVKALKNLGLLET